MATTPVEAEQRFHEHQPYAAAVIRRMLERFPFEYLDRESLFSAGMLGLWDASQRYDPQEGASFLTYATKRIRGAFIDELRKQSTFNRQQIEEHRVYEERRNWYQQLRGYDVSDETLAELLNLSDKQAALMHLMSNYGFDDISEVGYRLEHISDGPDERAQVNDDLVFLSMFIKRFTERDRFIMREHYAMNRTLASIAAELGVTESRVCQIHGGLIEKLRTYAMARSPSTVLLRYESAAASSARRVQDRARRVNRQLREGDQPVAGEGVGLPRRDDECWPTDAAGDGEDRVEAVADCGDAEGGGSFAWSSADPGLIQLGST